MSKPSLHMNIIIGVGLSLLGYLCTALMSCSVKALPNISITTLIFFQSVITLIIIIPAILKNRLADLKIKQPLSLIVRSLSGLLTMIAMFYAIKHIPLVDAVLLQNTGPLFVPVILLLWLRKLIPHKLWSGLLIGFIGVILILKPTSDIFNFAALIGLAAGVFTAITIVAISILKKTESTNGILFYYFLLSALLTLPLTLLNWPALDLKQTLSIISMGVFMYLAQALITQAFHYASATLLAPLSYAAVVFAGLLNWLFWHHVPDLISSMGILFVILGGMITIVLDVARRNAAKSGEHGKAYPRTRYRSSGLLFWRK